MRRFSVRVPSLIVLLSGVMLLGPSLITCNSASTTPTVPAELCDHDACLAYVDWAVGIDKAINQHAVGYTYLILDHGRVVAKKTFGLAHTDADPPAVALSSAYRMNIASVTKTLTAVAALKLLASRHVSIDTPIYPYLPRSWILGPNVNRRPRQTMVSLAPGTTSCNTRTTLPGSRSLDSDRRGGEEHPCKLDGMTESQ
jgi:CubicO group peptidase (beta-lactamase class C family)